MMRSSNSKSQDAALHSETPLQNGLPPDDEGEVRELAAKVVDDVVRIASETAAAGEKKCCNKSPPSCSRRRSSRLQRLPTIQIDTAPTPPTSFDEWSPPGEDPEESPPPIEETDVQIELQTVEQESETQLRENLRPFIEDIVSQAMVVAEKKLQFVGVPNDEDDEDEAQSVSVEQPSEFAHSRSKPNSESEKDPEDAEIREAAQRVVEEVITMATEAVEDRLKNGIADLNFPVKFDDAPEDVRNAATAFVKEIVGKAVAMAEEKSVPTVPFNFEDVNLIKSSGPWYVRAREAFINVLRTACFCTPRRTDS